MHDLQALQLPEKRKGRVFVEALIQIRNPALLSAAAILPIRSPA